MSDVLKLPFHHPPNMHINDVCPSKCKLELEGKPRLVPKRHAEMRTI